MVVPDWLKQPTPDFDHSNVSPGWLVSSEVSKNRFKICEQCPHFNNSIKTCKICGCFMPVKVKVKIMKCPDNPPRWE